jgi:hypothetical protein
MWGNTFDRRKIAHLAWLAGASWYDGDLNDVVFASNEPLRVLVGVPDDQPRNEFPSVDALMNFVEQHSGTEIWRIDGYAVVYQVDLP